MTAPPRFATDPAVPHRDLLLDPAAIASRLDGLLGADGPVGITRVEQLHVRYRVGRGVGLLLGVHTPGGRRLVSARSFEPGRGRSALARALEDEAPPIAGLRPVALAGELDTVFWTFPRDRRLRSLDLLLGRTEALSTLVGVEHCVPVLAAYVPEKTATARCLDERGQTRAYVKLYAPSEHRGGLDSFTLLRSLHAALDQGNEALRLPRALGYDPTHGAVTVQALPGEPLVPNSPNTHAAQLAGLGAALATLHQVRPPVGVRPFQRLAPDRLRAVAAVIGRVRPDVGHAAQELAARLASGHEHPGSPVCLHGDVHGKNALTDGSAVALIDLDQAAAGSAAADLGSMFAGIRYQRCLGQMSDGRANAFADALLDGYRSVRRLPSERSLSWHTAAALLGERAARSVTRVRPAGLAHLGQLLEAGLQELPASTPARTCAKRNRRARKPSLLLYCQHAVGLGHLTRSVALAGALAGRFEVTLLSGGEVPRHVTAPPGVDLVQLPPLLLADGGDLRSSDPNRTVEQAKAVRVRMLLGAVRTRRPAAVLVELFPFGRKAFAAEIMAMLDRARALPRGRPLIACSVRDILVGRGRQQPAHDERASRIANQNFDAILVHCDPRFATLEESFRPTTPLRVPVHYTGFVTAARSAAPQRGRSKTTVVVSAGGGRVGEPLLQAAIDAFPRLRRERGIDMRMISGPFVPEDAWRRLAARVNGVSGLVLLREIEDLSAELDAAAVSVSQCGYNTALEVIKSRTPAVVVPYLAPGEDEQLRRARRLRTLGAIRLIEPRQLDGSQLARQISGLVGNAPRHVELDLGGAATTAELLWRMIERPLAQTEAAIA